MPWPACIFSYSSCAHLESYRKEETRLSLSWRIRQLIVQVWAVLSQLVSVPENVPITLDVIYTGGPCADVSHYSSLSKVCSFHTNL